MCLSTAPDAISGFRPFEEKGWSRWSGSLRGLTDELEDAIQTNAAGPKSVSGDSGSVQQHSLPDVIVSDKYLASKGAMARKGLGLTRVKIVPPGTV